MEVVGIVQVLPGSVGCKKIAGLVVGLASIAAALRGVVRQAALVVARAVAGSWYTLIIQTFRFFPQRYNGNG